MIRFVSMKGIYLDETPSFGFYDTITDTFINIADTFIFDSIKEYEDMCREAQGIDKERLDRLITKAWKKGQCTRLYDKGNIEITEGDIILIEDDISTRRKNNGHYEVFWLEDIRAYVLFKAGDKKRFMNGKEFYNFNLYDSPPRKLLYKLDPKEIEIIGNIYDNPKLLVE